MKTIFRHAAQLGPQPASGDSRKFEKFYAVVRTIPRGRVTTYGYVALLAGLPGRARLAGTALGALPTNTTVPWHRVINAGGKISKREDSGWPSQRTLLEKEGVEFSKAGVVSLEKFGWRGKPGR
jgi:methylated-DNA-protein-cysteine methyltransferase related protein